MSEFEPSAVLPVPAVVTETTTTTAPIPDTTTTTTTTTTVPAAPVTTTASVTVTDVPALSDEALLLSSYVFGQRGSEVVALQAVLGLTTDGWYGTPTRDAHLARLTSLSLTTSGVPDDVAAMPATVGDGSSSALSSQERCRIQAALFVATVLSTWGIPSPQIVFDDTITNEYYKIGWGVVVVNSCSAKTSIAHELGHYALDLANGYNWSAHAGEAASYFSSGGWIKGAESSPGVEYAAHCIGWVLHGEGTYTRCPNNDMREHARAVLARSGSAA